MTKKKTETIGSAINSSKAEKAGTEKWHSADESSMIREQERQARERKKKKHRRKKQIAAVVVIALVVGGIWYAGWGRTLLATDTEETVAVSAGLGQEIIYAQLTAIRGNEITYTVAKVVDTDEAKDDTAQTTGGEGGRMPEGMGGRMPEGMGAQMPEGMGGQMPEGMGGRMPEGMGAQNADEMQGQQGAVQFQGQTGGRTGRGERTEHFGSDFGGGFAGADSGMGSADTLADTGFTYDNVTYQLTEESITTQIPVGTDVTTRLGTVTTFSRLAAGDRIALVVEEEDGEQIIMAVYIIG